MSKINYALTNNEATMQRHYFGGAPTKSVYGNDDYTIDTSPPYKDNQWSNMTMCYSASDLGALNES